MIVPFDKRHVCDVIPIHRDAFAGYMNTRLGDGYVRAFLEWFIDNPACSVALVAEHEGRTAGYVVGCLQQSERTMVRAISPMAARGLVRRPWLVLQGDVRNKVKERLRLLARRGGEGVQPPPLTEPVMGLIGIGVASCARGHKLGSGLMDAFEAACVARGMGSMFLSVYPDNRAARALYEGHGWQTPPGDPFGGRALYYAKTL